jgi:hypothetical protein
MSTLTPTVNKNWRLTPAGLISEYGKIALQFFALLIAFKINRKIEWLAPSLWILLPLTNSAVLVRARFAALAKPVVILWTWVGLLSAMYSLMHYPLVPALPEMHARYAMLLAACPFCRSYVSLMRLRQAVGKVNLVDARGDGSAAVDMLNAKGYDLNEGMAVIFGGYYGSDAVVFISSMTHPVPLLSKLLAGLLRNKTRAMIIYPIMKLGRSLTLRILGVPLLLGKAVR